MSTFAHQLLLVASVCFLGAAGFRAASALAPRGLERAVAAATLAAAAAGLEAIVLGFVSLAGRPLVLAAAAAATWAVALLALPAPRLGAGRELLTWWRRTPPATRVGLGAVGGAGLAWAAWLVHVPALGFDSVNYHVPEVVVWLRDGDTGSVIHGVLDRVTYIPLMSEVLLAWQVGIARTLVPISLWAPATMLLMATAGWLGLRTLAVPRAAAAIGVAALCATPIVTHYQMNGAYNDLPALAWLVATAALAAASRRNPSLLAPALLAGALAAGTKTTALPLALLVLVLAAWPERRRLRPLALPLALAGAAALLLGGLWYARDLAHHGSPFWPDFTTPWGDPAPTSSPSFLDRPRATLDRFGHEYSRLLLGALVMWVSALVVPLLTRARAVWAASAVTLVSILLWLSAPATGAAQGGSAVGTVSTLRYGLPALAAAITTLALATREPGRARLLAGTALGAGLLLGVVQTHNLGYPSVPSIAVLLAGAALGGAAAAVLGVLGDRIPRWTAAPVAALGAVAVAAALTIPVSGYVQRHASANATTSYPYAPLISWLVNQPDYLHGDATVAMAPIPNGVVVGDRFRHRLELIPFHEPCARVRARLRDQWVLINYLGVVSRYTAARCLARVHPSFQGPGFRAYRP